MILDPVFSRIFLLCTVVKTLHCNSLWSWCPLRGRLQFCSSQGTRSFKSCTASASGLGAHSGGVCNFVHRKVLGLLNLALHQLLVLVPTPGAFAILFIARYSVF